LGNIPGNNFTKKGNSFFDKKGKFLQKVQDGGQTLGRERCRYFAVLQHFFVFFNKKMLYKKVRFFDIFRGVKKCKIKSLKFAELLMYTVFAGRKTSQDDRIRLHMCALNLQQGD